MAWHRDRVESVLLKVGFEQMKVGFHKGEKLDDEVIQKELEDMEWIVAVTEETGNIIGDSMTVIGHRLTPLGKKQFVEIAEEKEEEYLSIANTYGQGEEELDYRRLLFMD